MINKIHFEDSYDTLLKMDDGCVDLMIQDTPFGVTQNEWDIAPDFEKMWPEWLRVGKENCAYLFFGTQPFISDLISSNRKMYKHEWIWKKNRGSNFANTVREPFKEHEHIVVFSRGSWTYNPVLQKREGGGLDRVKYDFNTVSESSNYRKFEKPSDSKGKEMRVPSSVQKFNTETGLHPTQKPIDLIRYLIKTYSNEGELVFDGYMGSGTTAAACIEEGRKFIGSENKIEYFNICQSRISTLLATPKLF